MKRLLQRLLTTGALAWERWTRTTGRTGEADHVLVLHFPGVLGLAMAEIPLLEALKQLQPAPRVTVATTGAGLELLRHSPVIDRLIAVPHPALGLRTAARALRGQVQDVDCVLLGSADRQRAIVRLAWLATKAWRGGFAEEARTMQRPLTYDAGLSVIANNLRVAKLLGWHGAMPQPRLYFTAEQVRWARDQLPGDGRPVLLVVSQGSSACSSWLPSRMAEVLRYARETLGYTLIFDGGPGQNAAVEELRAMVGESHSVAGKTGLRQLAALAALSDLVLSVDTGPMHVVASTGVPIVVLSPQWATVKDWHPLRSEQVCILHSERTGPVQEDYRMQELSVALVREALDGMAKRFPPSLEAREGRVKAWCTERDLLR